MPHRPLRTWLFAPGTDRRKTEKALAGEADAVILDLEDAVALSEKAEARRTLQGVLSEVAPERQVWVRVNDLTTGMTADDLAAVCTGGLAGVFLPKVESAEAVRLASGLIDSLGHGLPADRIRLVGLVETARGLLNLPAIAAAGGRLDGLMFGAGDFTTDLGIPTANTGPHILNGKIQTALACRANRLLHTIDAVYFDVKDAEGYLADCSEGKALGFTGKGVIHPGQVGPANDTFAPTAEEIAFAERVVASFREAEARGVGAIQVDGKLVDYPMVRSAERVLAAARALDLA